MTSRPLTRLRAPAQPQAGEESMTGQPRQTLTVPLRAPAQPQAGEESMTGRPRRALTGLGRALAGEGS